MIDEIQKYLLSKNIGRRIFYFDNLDSTSLEAFRLIDANKASFGDIVVAKTQTSGRGQQGNEWQSPEGGLYMSIITASKATETSNLITFASAISCVEAVNSLTQIQPKLKWVNDVIVDNRKLAGILTESVTRGNISTNVIGIGINANINISNALNTKYKPVSLRELTGSEINIPELIASVCNCFEKNFGTYQLNPEMIVQDWLKHSAVIGKNVEFSSGNSIKKGTVKGINQLGFLVVEVDDEEFVLTSTRKISAIC